MNAYDGAEQKGYEAALRGEGDDACPYPDHRTYQNKVTFSRGFRKAWFIGHERGLRAALSADTPREDG